MPKESKDKRKPIRFLVSEEKHKELMKEAKKIDVPLSSYIKMRLGEKNA